MKKYSVSLGLLIIVAALVWKVGFSERLFDQRFPDGWSWEVNSLGVTGYPDPETGQFAEGTTLADDPLNLTFRTVSASTADVPAGQVHITDHYVTQDPISNAVTWEYTSEAIVDSRTGQYPQSDFEGNYYLLPRNPEKNITYFVTNSSYRNLPMTFQREESVGGINTYLFANYEPLDNTLANASLVTLELGQEVWCFDFALEYWVEPITGEIVKYREWCEGDWIINVETGERLGAVSRWGGETTGDDLIRSANRVNAQLNTYNWLTLYVPLLAGVLGVVLLAVGLLPTLFKPSPQGTKVATS